MGMKHFYIFTVLLFSFTTAIADGGTGDPFPFEGGTTSDGIVISTPEINGFMIAGETKELKIIEEKGNNPKEATLTFSVTVPDGKVAALEYKALIKLMKAPKAKVKNPLLSFEVTMDGNVVRTHPKNKQQQICVNSEIITIPTGPHKFTFEAAYEAENCIMSGGINAMYIHVHDFGEPMLARQPICGQPGTTNCECIVCGIDSTITIAPQYKDHSLINNSTTKSSCLSNMGALTKCEHCPYSVIVHKGVITGHTFDDNDVCTSCGMRKPKSNAEHSVYEVNNASEMRVLAEMVSLGTIPGNIGIDIKADLVFSTEMSMLPLGTVEHPFQGVINGNGHRIRGIVNCFQGVDCLGFVGVAKGTPLSHAVIANLIFDSENTMRGTSCVGGIVGYAAYTDIINCASFGVLEGNNYVGSIVGYADQQVSFHNCASVSSIRTHGNWNPMACGLINGHILNSYGAATNSQDGHADELPTTTFRHCFTTMGSDEGLTLVSRELMSSYNMLELLNEQSETPTFMMSQKDIYPLPVVNTTIQASPNRAIPTTWKAIPRRAPMADLTDEDYEDNEKDDEIEVIGGYVNEAILATLGKTVEEVVSEDSVLYADFDRTYVATRKTTDESLELFKPMSGGELLSFKSFMLSPDSTSLKLTEYFVSSPEKVKAKVETIYNMSGANEVIDEYAIAGGSRNLISRTTIEGEESIIYQESVNGVLRTKWTINAVYDEMGEPIAVEAYTYDYKTGETTLQYRIPYSNAISGEEEDDESYEEYLDSKTNTIHAIFNHLDSITGAVISREHYILNAENEAILECLKEKMIDGEPYVTRGSYFVYDENGGLRQSVYYSPKDANKPGVDLCPSLYYEFLGLWEPDPYPTAIKLPTIEQPSAQKHTDYNVYDMHGRVVRKVTDTHNPFSGLPKGLYIYQGEKYLKRY